MTDWLKLHGTHFRQTRVLVTGGAGFIGSHLVEGLLALGATVVALDDLSGTDGSWENLQPFKGSAGDRLTLVQGSILESETVAQSVAGCRYVFHQAALGSVPKSVAEPQRFTEVNVTGTLNVLEAARAARVERVMFAASSSAYGDAPTLPKVETMPVLPRSPYAANKVACEAMMMAWACSYGMDTAALRYFNIFGPRQNANSAYAAVIAAFAKAIVAGTNPVIYGDGEQSRDFTFVHNVVHANLLAARSREPLGGQVINIACGTRITVNELAVMMAQMMGRPDLKAEHHPDRAGDVKHSLAELTRARLALGYEPIVDFPSGLKPTVAWYQQVLGG
ncbi:MAG: NAD-dependent epimerase/dehydratase family protein [Phycisphaeraceae bacterium]